MAAKLQAMGYEAYFYEPAAGGHGYGKDNRERASFTALGYNFLRRAIGWEPGRECMTTASSRKPFHFAQWIDAHSHLLKPPSATNCLRYAA